MAYGQETGSEGHDGLEDAEVRGTRAAVRGSGGRHGIGRGGGEADMGGGIGPDAPVGLQLVDGERRHGGGVGGS